MNDPESRVLFTTETVEVTECGHHYSLISEKQERWIKIHSLIYSSLSCEEGKHPLLPPLLSSPLLSSPLLSSPLLSSPLLSSPLLSSPPSFTAVVKRESSPLSWSVEKQKMVNEGGGGGQRVKMENKNKQQIKVHVSLQVYKQLRRTERQRDRERQTDVRTRASLSGLQLGGGCVSRSCRMSQVVTRQWRELQEIVWQWDRQTGYKLKGHAPHAHGSHLYLDLCGQQQ